MNPVRITAWTVTTALGRGRDTLWQALRAARTGLEHRAFDGADIDCWTGQVAGLESLPLEGEWSAWDCRNNRLAALALAQDGFAAMAAAACRRYGSRRVSVFVGTSTSGVAQTERAYRERTPPDGALPAWFDYQRTQSAASVAEFVRARLGLDGACAALSAACASSAKVFAAAARALRAGVCDAAVVGGVDSLCFTTLYGFRSLQLVSPDICRPADAARDGISIGEAGGFALLERGAPVAGEFALLGYGESSDAHHMSQPRPDGLGAIAAMRGALQSAALEACDIDYINLHGTATVANDAMEDAAVHALFGGELPCSSTKGWTGHTLGAAGIVEAAIALTCVERGFLPQSLNLRHKDPALRGNVLLDAREAKVGRVLSNSFGFGGANCSLVLGRAP